MALKSSMKLRARAFFFSQNLSQNSLHPPKPRPEFGPPPLNPAQNLEHPQENTPFPSGYQCTLP